MDPQAKARGRDAENQAAKWLRSLGYEILARNLRTRSGEIDVIARDGATLVLVEVRYRNAHVFDAWRSLAGGKRERFARAAHEAQAALGVPLGTPARLDVVLVSAEGGFTHVRGALPPRPTYDR